jgi:hypothetical protein
MELKMQTIQAQSGKKAKAHIAAGPALTASRDELGERLIAAGLEHNEFLLDLNRALSVPHDWVLPAPWNLPSRLFRFPIEVGEFSEGERRIGLMHPALVDHPYVQHVSQVLGMDIPPCGAPNMHGYSKQAVGLWWHAVDLIPSGHWREALETRRFTTDKDMLRAVTFGLSCNRSLTTSEARQIFQELGVACPSAPRNILCEFDRPSPVRGDDKVERWPVNTGMADAGDTAWAMVIGIETGWFTMDRSGHLAWTQLGRDNHQAGASTTFIEQSTGQGAFAF